ncbi:hypothetical protein [Nocardioides pakistanensis]
MGRLHHRLEERRDGAEDKGLALLDVLIGMAIFALIAIIALSAIGQFRQRAFETSVTSDARSIGTTLEADFTTNQAYPDTSKLVGSNHGSSASPEVKATYGGGAAMVIDGLSLTRGVTIKNYTNLDGAGVTGFKFCVEHTSGSDVDAWAAYNSTKGGVVGSGRGAGCSSAAAQAALS